MLLIFLPCGVAGYLVAAACGQATGYEHLKCIHVHIKDRGQRDSGCTHCPTVRREVCQKDSYCAGRQLGAGLGWGPEGRTPGRCEMMQSASVTMLTQASTPQHLRSLRMKIGALGSRAKLRRASALQAFPWGLTQRVLPRGLASGTVWCSLSDKQVPTVCLSACLSAFLSVSALLICLSSANSSSPVFHHHASTLRLVETPAAHSETYSFCRRGTGPGFNHMCCTTSYRWLYY